MRAVAAAVASVVLVSAWARAQVPAGPEFRLNTYTTDLQSAPRLALDPAGNFVAVWTSRLQANSAFSVHGQRYGAGGAPAGAEFRVDTGTFGAQPGVAVNRQGKFAVAWHDNLSAAPFDIRGRLFTAQGQPRGGEFTVNTSTAGNEYRADLAPLFGGGFVVVWSQNYLYNVPPGRILAQRYDAFGARVGGELLVNAPTSATNALFPQVSSAADGRFAVTWLQQSASPNNIQARLYTAAGVPVGPPLVVPSTPDIVDRLPDVAMQGDGGFLVVWQRGDVGNGIRGRLFSPAGAPVAPQFTVTAGADAGQGGPSVAADRRGNFVVAWAQGGAGFARRFDSAGNPRSGDFALGVAAPGPPSDIISDEVGNFTAGWPALNQDGSSTAAMARRFGGLIPTALAVDTAAASQSDGNGVLEPGEAVDVRPSWQNETGASQSFTGTLTLFAGPPATYTIVDGDASYGTVASGASGRCVTADCYVLGVSAATRPAQHWDGVFYEALAPDVQGQRKEWRLHVGDTFTDVPRANIYYRFVETLIHNFVTAGCAATSYCPQEVTTREQMSVFVLVARDAAGDAPPVCTTPLFADVPASSGYCRWIEELARSGVATGCGGGNFCPGDPVSREQMSVFMLRTLDGTLTPPACGTPVFADVPASSPYCRWIEELARRGVVSGCGNGNFCPTAPVTREQMAVFISGTFGLKLYGPQLP